MDNVKWYMMWAKYFSSESNCFSRKIGAILVNDGEIIGIGHNGPPKELGSCLDHGVINEELQYDYYKKNPATLSSGCIRKRMSIVRSGEGMQYCLAHHAEQNAIIYAAKFGRKTNGGTLYITCGIPCIECCKAIINAGIANIYCVGGVDVLSAEKESAYNFEFSAKMLDAAKINVYRVDAI